MVDIDQCEGSSFFTHIAQAVLNCHAQILMRYIPLVTVTHFYFEVCIFLSMSSNCFTVMIARQSKAELARWIMKFKLHP